MKIVTICGSLRAKSSNAALLRIVAAIAPAGMEVVHYTALGELPHFNPELDPDRGAGEPPATVRMLRELLIGADGVLISSPEYAHGVPGSMKNALDWLVSVGELVDKPVALLNAAPFGGDFAQASLVETLRTMNWNVVTEASLLAPFLRKKIGVDDTLAEPAAMETLRTSLEAFAAAITAANARG